jgi:hypothetical protein
VDQDTIIRYVADTFPNVEVGQPAEGPGAGDTFFIYDPWQDGDPKRQMPFATIVTKDYPGWDAFSNLDRPGVYRLNIGVSRETFLQLLGITPEAATGSDGTAPDYAALDQLMPHPTYAAQGWVSVLNPSAETFEALKPLLAEAYGRIADRYARSQASRG